MASFSPLLLTALGLAAVALGAQAQTPASSSAIADVGDFNPYPLRGGPQAGSEPSGGLTYDPQNGLYYGVAIQGSATPTGEIFGGDIFSFNLQTGAIADVGNFPNGASVPDFADGAPGGAFPQGPLAYDPVNNMFYGTMSAYGVNDEGIVFSFDPANPNPATSLADAGDFNATVVYPPFSPVPPGGAQPAGGTNTAVALTPTFLGGAGAFPNSSLLYVAATNKFYGTASAGGANSDGTVFQFDPTVSDRSASLTDVGDFGVSNRHGGDNGEGPRGGLTQSGSVFYGAAPFGGVTSAPVFAGGDVYEFNPSLPAPLAVTDVGDFDLLNGELASSPPVYDPDTGKFYGAAAGGLHDAGLVYAFDPTVTDPAASVTDAADFGVGNGGGPGSLTYDAAQDVFYGTAGGGANSDGEMFAFNPADTDAATAAVDVADFNGADGEGGEGALTLISGVYYGTSPDGGALDGGNLFAFTPPATLPAAGTFFPSFQFSPGLQMASLSETYTSLAEVFDLTPAASAPDYAVYSGAYQFLPGATSAPALGQGFWIDPTSALTLHDTGAAAPATVSVPLVQGWNLIGNPYNATYPMAALSVTTQSGQTAANLDAAVADGLLSGTLYTWGPNDSRYTPVSNTSYQPYLSPFTGYWLYAFQPGETLILPSGEVQM